MLDMAGDEPSDAERVVVCSQVDTKVEQWSHAAPRTVEQQVVAVDEHNLVRRLDHDLSGEGFLQLAMETGGVHRFGTASDPRQKRDEAVDIERVRRALSGRSTKLAQHRVREVESIHWDHHRSMVNRIALSGDVGGERGLADAGRAGESHKEPRPIWRLRGDGVGRLIECLAEHVAERVVGCFVVCFVVRTAGLRHAAQALPTRGTMATPQEVVPASRNGPASMPNRPSVFAAVKPLATTRTQRSGKGKRQAHEPLDDINRAIITELQIDGRRSYTAIAERVGLSEAAVRQRVQRLTDDGVMQIVAVTDPIRLGFKRVTMVALRVSGDATEVADKLSKVPEVGYVVIAGGTYDLLAEVVCEDDDHLIEVLNKTIRVFPGVRETETFMYLRVHKESYTWGVPSK